MSRRQLTQAPGALLLFALLSFAAVCQAGTAEQRSVPARELPSDAEMIAHFQVHRADFEELVKLYQTDKRRVWRTEKGNYQPFDTDDYKELLKRAGIRHLRGGSLLWLPDPYSIEAARQAKAMDPFHAYPHHDIFFYVENLTSSPRIGRSVWKGYFYVPVVPKVDADGLWCPRSPHGGEPKPCYRVRDSLDGYPPDWLSRRKADCVLRRIEPQWFLRMCVS